MGRKNKRKNRSSGSGCESTQDAHVNKKYAIERGPSVQKPVSDILNETNSVLYDDSLDDRNPTFACDSIGDSSVDSVFPPSPVGSNRGENTKMATTEDSQPTNSDIMTCLKGIDSRLKVLEKRMDSIDELKIKVDGFDKDLKKLWLAVEDRNKAVDLKVNVLEEKIESCDFSVGKLSEDVEALQRDRDAVSEDLIYMQSQSMRNNLIFSNIPEATNETNEDVERALRQFICEKLKVAKGIADEIVFERVHRMGQRSRDSTSKRHIIAKFHQFKDREMVRKQWPNLKGTNFYISEQFPKQIVDKRKRLYPKLKAARDAGKRAWISYDTLYIDGKAVKD